MFIPTFFRSVHVVLLLTATNALGAVAAAVNTTTSSNTTTPAVSSDVAGQLQTGLYSINWIDTSLGEHPTGPGRIVGASNNRVAVLPVLTLPVPSLRWHIERKAALTYAISLNGKAAGFGPENSIELSTGAGTEWSITKAPPGSVGDNGFIIARPIQGLRRAVWEVPNNGKFLPGTIPLVIGEAGTVLQIVRAD